MSWRERRWIDVQRLLSWVLAGRVAGAVVGAFFGTLLLVAVLLSAAVPGFEGASGAGASRPA